MEHQSVQLRTSSMPFRRRRRVTLRFCLPYYTHWGQSLAVLGSVPALGSWVSTRALPMSPLHQGEVLYWIASLQVVPEDLVGEAIYSYVVVDHNTQHVLRRESGAPRSFQLPADLNENTCIDIYDLWQDSSSPESFLFRSAFQEVILQSKAGGSHPSQAAQKALLLNSSIDISSQEMVLVRFKICCPRVQAGQDVCLVGDFSYEGHVIMSPHGNFWWQGECMVERSKFPVKYRYVVKDGSGVVSEEEAERELRPIAADKSHPAIIVSDDGYFKVECSSFLKKLECYGLRWIRP